jgi:3-oxoacyl-[acyl-carrier protein] reductase
MSGLPVVSNAPAETPTPLDGRVVILTGSGRGLGLETAGQLLAQGAAVVANHRSPSSGLVDLLGKYPGRLRLVPGDVAEEETVIELVAEARRLGGPQVVIHNAAIARDQLLVRTPVEDWDAVHRVNLRAAFLLTKHALKPMMRARYGRVLYVSSVVALNGNTGQASYASSKAGLHGLAFTVAQEYSSYNIRSAVIAPGILDTGMGVSVQPNQQRRMVDRSLLGLGQADQTAGTLAFLAGPHADYINATVIRTDGGMRY